MATDKTKHILELSEEILGDIELDRLALEKLIYKGSRLARLIGNENIETWLNYEMHGYNSTEPESLKFVGATGRWINKEELKAYWGPVALQEHLIELETANLNKLILTDNSNMGLLNKINQLSNSKTEIIATRGRIRNNVRSMLYKFVNDVHYEIQFANLSESIFDKYKNDVDLLIAKHCGSSVLSKIPSVIDRLSENGDAESISQALLTIRRIIDSFADSIFPPTDETYEFIKGKESKLDASKHLNRINVYIAQRTESESRRKKIGQNLLNLYERASAGVHSDVSAEEAKSLYLNAYLILGEILHLDIS